MLSSWRNKTAPVDDDDDASDADSLSQSEGGALDAPLLPGNDQDDAAARREAAQAAAEPAERQLHGLRGPREPRVAALPTKRMASLDRGGRQ